MGRCQRKVFSPLLWLVALSLAWVGRSDRRGSSSRGGCAGGGQGSEALDESGAGRLRGGGGVRGVQSAFVRRCRRGRLLQTLQVR